MIGFALPFFKNGFRSICEGRYAFYAREEIGGEGGRLERESEKAEEKKVRKISENRKANWRSREEGGGVKGGETVERAVGGWRRRWKGR